MPLSVHAKKFVAGGSDAKRRSDNVKREEGRGSGSLKRGDVVGSGSGSGSGSKRGQGSSQFFCLGLGSFECFSLCCRFRMEMSEDVFCLALAFIVDNIFSLGQNSRPMLSP